jgi:hypothetical protein
MLKYHRNQNQAMSKNIYWSKELLKGKHNYHIFVIFQIKNNLPSYDFAECIEVQQDNLLQKVIPLLNAIVIKLLGD